MTRDVAEAVTNLNIFQVGFLLDDFPILSLIIRDLKNKTSASKKNRCFFVFLHGDEMLEITSIS